VPEDITRVLAILKEMSEHDNWQIRQASAHFLRCFQGGHKFLFSPEQADSSLSIAISLLSDDRREGKDSLGFYLDYFELSIKNSPTFSRDSLECGNIRSHRYTCNNATICTGGTRGEIHQSCKQICQKEEKEN
jgi:hypothetical protein